MTVFGPTHYVWRPDVAALVRRFETRYATKANNYEGHGEEPSREPRSVDFWALSGRGWPIPTRTGSAIFKRLRRRQGAPQYEYIIWRGYVYPRGGSRFRYGDASDQHFDHVHVTFV